MECTAHSQTIFRVQRTRSAVFMQMQFAAAFLLDNLFASNIFARRNYDEVNDARAMAVKQLATPLLDELPSFKYSTQIGRIYTAFD